VNDSSLKWVSLRDASIQLTTRFGLLGSQLIERVVRSGEVPVRGLYDQVNLIPARIEKKITSEMEVNVDFSLIQDRFAILWRSVEISWPECVQYCEANLIPPWAHVPTQHQARGPKPDKLEDAKRAMLAEIREQRLSREQLAKFTGKELAYRFGVGRTTATLARTAVLKDV
jgi:hypothetical protein